MAEAARGEVNWSRVADYLWRESGKWGQKTVPEGFASPGRSWGRWGVGLAVTRGQMDRGAAVELRRVLWGLYRRRDPARARRPRGMDGLTVFGIEPSLAHRLVSWAEATAAAKAIERDRRALQQTA